jgi:class 3 adenylate cyclase/predicted ATPase
MRSGHDKGRRLRSGSPSRRRLTIVFCDLVDSTVLAGNVDPEDYSALIRLYDDTVAREVEQLGGNVAQYVGDGILVYFGYPRAHEDDAERAVRAGLGVVDAVQRLSRLTPGAARHLAVRVGIHTGPVVIGEGGGAKARVFGQTPAVAVRIQAAADANTVFISRDTLDLVAGLFVVEDRGPRVLKGVADRTRLYRVVRPSGVRGRLDAVGHLTPLVDRESELRALVERWELARTGRGQVVTVVGEAGIGKSRLVRALQERLAAEPHTWIKCYASPHRGAAPFHPVADMLEHGFGWATASADRRVEVLARSLEVAGVEPMDAVGVIAPLVDVPVPHRYANGSQSPPVRRQAQLSTLVAWLVGLARVQPVVAVVEDLQWADPSTIELLAVLAEEAAAAPLLLVHTARPEFRVPWPLLAHHTVITLNRLSAERIRDVILHTAGRSVPRVDVVEALVVRSEGVPLFAEELARAVLETEMHGGTSSIPVSLADSLTARLDRLGTAKDVAQIGAVLGRDFPYALLRAMSPLSDRDLQRALARLSHADVLYVRGVPPDATCSFKHALMRDAAYEGLVRSARQDLHRRAAAMIRERFPEMEETHPDVLAHHCECAGDFWSAVRYWKRAGDRTVAHAAYAESIRLFERGLALLGRLPPGQRAQEELALVESLGTAYLMTRGYSAPDTEGTFRRALELCDVLGVHVPVRVLHGIWAFHIVRSDAAVVAGLVARFRELAERSQDPVTLIAAHATAGLHAFLTGDFVRARDEMAKAAEWYDTEHYRAFYREYGYDGGLYPFAFLMWIEWILGHPDRATAARDTAMALAERTANPYSFVIFSTFAAALAHDRREPDAARRLSERVIALATEQHLPSWLGPATCLHGWAVVQGGDVDEGTREIRRGLDLLHAIGFRTWYPYYLSFLGEADLARGIAAEGLIAVREALTLAHVLLDRFYEAELHRLEGELLRLQGDLPAADEAFERALEVASTQHARGFELRAAVSRGRLLRDRGDRAGARRLIEHVLHSFTDGFDTHDLREARALLDDLANAGHAA